MDEEFENLYEVFHYFLPSLKNFEFLKEQSNNDSSGGYHESEVNFVNKKEKGERISGYSTRIICEDLLQNKINESTNILLGYFREHIDKIKIFKILEVENENDENFEFTESMINNCMEYPK